MLHLYPIRTSYSSALDRFQLLLLLKNKVLFVSPSMTCKVVAMALSQTQESAQAKLIGEDLAAGVGCIFLVYFSYIDIWLDQECAICWD